MQFSETSSSQKSVACQTQLIHGVERRRSKASECRQSGMIFKHANLCKVFSCALNFVFRGLYFSIYNWINNGGMTACSLETFLFSAPTVDVCIRYTDSKSESTFLAVSVLPLLVDHERHSCLVILLAYKRNYLGRLHKAMTVISKAPKLLQNEGLPFSGMNCSCI